MGNGPLLVVELPTPLGREDEWNRWYHDVHIPDVLAMGVGVVESKRYRLMSGDDDVRYLVVHEFESDEALSSYVESPILEERWKEYRELWGHDKAVRRRAFTLIFSAVST